MTDGMLITNIYFLKVAMFFFMLKPLPCFGATTFFKARQQFLFLTTASYHALFC